METRTIISLPLSSLWSRTGDCSFSSCPRLLLCREELVTAALPSLLPKQTRHWFKRVLPNDTDMCVWVCVRVFSFPWTRIWVRGVTCHSFLGVVTTVIVARLSSRTRLILVLWHQLVPPVTSELYIHTDTHTGKEELWQSLLHICYFAYEYMGQIPGCTVCVYVTKVSSGYQASLKPGVCFSSSWKRGS